MQLTTYLHFGSLSSWLSLAPVRQLQAETNVDVALVPMLATIGNVVGRVDADDPLADYKARRSRAKHLAAAEEHNRMCELLGISRQAGLRSPDPLMASMGLLWLNTVSVSFSQKLDYCGYAYKQIFVDAAADTDPGLITRILGEMGLAADGFDGFAMEQEPVFKADDATLLDKGILYAPAFVLDGEIFHGRQHFPLMRWLITGEEGPPPV